ncbi:SDR family NAD(P)-dependent oxidoreductase [Rhizobium sp. NZLR11]|nr:SDR family NAD(P)-dependent oxidoreductase [Rhizobium sp. NZLR11]
MQIDLTGKTALITGSTEGIGYAIASQLATAGADVVINGRSEEKTAKAAARMKDEGPSAAPVPSRDVMLS